jgi:hypothetical protein
MTDRVALLFAIEDADSDSATVTAALVRDLNEQREWTHGEIAFVDELDEISATQPHDEPIRTLGGVLTLTRPTDDLADERSHYEDVEFLIGRLCEFSSGGLTLVIEYDGEEVGEIRDGQADVSLRVGLLGEWRKRVREP